MSAALTEQEYQKLSHNFRSYASRFLKCNFYEYHDCLKRFLIFIEDSPTISNFIQENNVEEFNIEQIINEKTFNQKFRLPIKKSEEIAFIFQLFNYISENKLDIRIIAIGYSSSKRYQDKVAEFNNMVARPLVDHISTYLTEVKIDLGYDKKSGTHFTFNRDFKGQFNHAQDQGQISAHQTYNETNVEGLKELAEKFIEELQKNDDIPEEKKEETVEFLEAAVQEVESDKPKKAIVKTAMEKVRGINELATAGKNLFTLGGQLIDSLAGMVG
ncbi:hypothetical protein [Virgibacillus halodenitrificans]|uniref:hypothetical protein n=1 Tax=Virgibacillus halodenitrificans TaxID=1482 RepID=UPI00045CE8F9|nr:hypothetical protein [Virgibacillus halodenitrificans]CDQ31900.1 hypothetical protein BN993_01285 [Virgibacillus halodenitrificans]